MLRDVETIAVHLRIHRQHGARDYNREYALNGGVGVLASQPGLLATSFLHAFRWRSYPSTVLFVQGDTQVQGQTLNVFVHGQGFTTIR